MDSKRLFNDLVLELKARIESYKENGFEYRSLENALNSIIKECDSDIKTLRNGPFMAEEKNKNYARYYSKLLDLITSNQKEFDNFMFLMFAKYIKSANITVENLNEFINNTISYLQKCRDNISTNLNVDIIFDSLLDLVLMELTIKDNSNLLDYIKCYSEYCYFLNRVASKRVDNLNEESVKVILNREGSLGELFPYIEEDMLKLMASNNNSLRDDIIKQVGALHKKLEEIEKEKANITYHIKEINQMKNCRKNVIKSLALSLCLIVAPISIGALLYKPMLKVENYNTVIEEYSIDDGITVHDEVIGLVNETGEETLILEYEPWEKSRSGFRRDYKEYDVSHIDYEDLAQYLLLDLEKLGIKCEEKREYKDALTPEDLYTDNECVVKNYKQDLNNPIITYSIDESFDGITYVFILIVAAFSEIFSVAHFLDSISYLKDHLKVNKELKANLGVDLKELLDQYAEANKDINKIQNELVAFYNKYKFLLERENYKENYPKLKRGQL